MRIIQNRFSLLMFMSVVASSCSLFQGGHGSTSGDSIEKSRDSKPVQVRAPSDLDKTDHLKKPEKKNIKSFQGQASYYKSGTGLSTLTASGEKFDDTLLTAAHRDLPFGTFVRVVNLKNNKFVEVRINDRGPFSPERLIDITLAAAKKIEMLDQGIIPVRIEILD
jgi:rare lipoprotein A (peptidoglycan hydrolase)